MDLNQQPKFYETGGVPPSTYFLQDRLQKCSCGNTYVGMPGGRCTACIADDITRSVIAMRETLNGTLANNEGANEQ